MERKVFPIAFLAAAASMLIWLTGFAGAAPAPQIVTGIDAGWPDVRAWDRFGTRTLLTAPWGSFPLAFSPYPTYENGVRVAVGDVDGDGKAEIITAPGKSAFTELRVFDGRTFEQRRSLLPFKDANWWAGAFVATGDTTGDGRDEIVEGLDAGCCTTLHVLDGVTGSDLTGFFPYGDRSEVGARVAAADVNADGKDEILAVPRGSARISVYAASGGSAVRTIDAFAESAGETSIAAGDLFGDARPELVAAAWTPGGMHTKVIDLATGATHASFFPYGGAGTSSVEVALGDIDGDARLDLVTSALTAGGTEVKAVDVNGTELMSFYVLDPAIVPGASLAAGDLDGDGRAEIVLGGGPTRAPWPPVANGPDQRVAVYRADGTRMGAFSAYPGLFQGGVRVALADMNDDRRPEILTAPGPGMESEIGVFTQDFVVGRDRGTRLRHFLAFEPSFQGGLRVAAGDVDGNGSAEIVVGAGPGRPAEVRVLDAAGRRLLAFHPFGSDYTGGITVAVGDLNGDAKAEIVAGTETSPARIRAFAGAFPYGPVMTSLGPTGAGVEVAVADFSGTGRGMILAAPTTAPTRLVVLEPLSGSVLRAGDIASDLQNGIHLAAGDLDTDGRDEVVITPRGSGDGRVRILDEQLAEVRSFAAQDWPAGLNVGVATRIGLPVAAEARLLRLRARKRAQVVVARFHDAAGGRTGSFRAAIKWGDGIATSGKVITRGDGVYDVRGTKRYGRAGRYTVTVTVTDAAGRTSIARSRAIVARR